jgi:hypothetical protein
MRQIVVMKGARRAFRDLTTGINAGHIGAFRVVTAWQLARQLGKKAGEAQASGETLRIHRAGAA